MLVFHVTWACYLQQLILNPCPHMINRQWIDGLLRFVNIRHAKAIHASIQTIHQCVGHRPSIVRSLDDIEEITVHAT
ncbi:MAG: hypothetical protein ACI9WC_002915 [Arenicella sp.]|jgi:hypothetical protein